ncbi:MAG: type I-G CRISPR-associated protein Csb2 [Actinomycetota bacterium]
MTTTLVVTLPWGMYHGTPWAGNVNEGAIDWPPSPWRVLRALFATWKTRVPHLDELTVHGLLDDLSGPPVYTLPSFTEAHTRHYMPDAAHKLGLSGATDKVIDAFVVTERDASIGITWDVDLEEDRHEALVELSAMLPYLGRAESVCTARVADPGERIEGVRCAPVDDVVPADAPVRLLVPTCPLDLAALTARTTDVRRGGHLDPPGANWVEYTPPEPSEPRARQARRRHNPPTAVRWAVVANAQPSIHAAVSMADALREATMSSYGARFDGGASATLVGKTADARPLRDHQHAHYLALDLDGDRLLDTALIWAPGGLDLRDVEAAARLTALRGRSFVKDLRPCRLGLEAIGAINAAAPELVGPARTWTSHTPFSPARHGRHSDEWGDHVAAEVRRELGYRRFPEPRTVRIVGGGWLDFRRHRLKERLEGARRAIGVEIEFEDAVEGPIALGALSHFGLGLFLPAD